MQILKRWVDLANEVRTLPRLTVDLQCAGTADNDPFFERITRDFYAEATRRHRKFPLIRQYEYGFCLCVLPKEPEGYARAIESSGRRNYKKAQRMGYTFDRLECNAHIKDIDAILKSTEVRQGRPMPSRLMNRKDHSNHDPSSHSNRHDYPYFGVFRDGQLYAYAACLIAGDLCAIQTIYGHADHQENGIVPMLLIGMAERVARDYPGVKYYAYGSYYGASETLQRFKRKFCFMPHVVNWRLGA